jgi:hypothetical protein
MLEATHSSETSVPIRATRRHIPEDGLVINVLSTCDITSVAKADLGILPGSLCYCVPAERRPVALQPGNPTNTAHAFVYTIDLEYIALEAKSDR